MISPDNFSKYIKKIELKSGDVLICDMSIKNNILYALEGIRTNTRVKLPDVQIIFVDDISKLKS